LEVLKFLHKSMWEKKIWLRWRRELNSCFRTNNKNLEDKT
jgi:hypothetical protein